VPRCQAAILGDFGRRAIAGLEGINRAVLLTVGKVVLKAVPAINSGLAVRVAIAQYGLKWLHLGRLVYLFAKEEQFQQILDRFRAPGEMIPVLFEWHTAFRARSTLPDPAIDTNQTEAVAAAQQIGR